MAKRSKKKRRLPEVKVGQVEVAEPTETVPVQETPRQKFPALNWLIFVQALIITAAVLWIYWPALHGGWQWDDDVLVTDNAVVHEPSGLWKIWFEPGLLVDYQPPTISVFWLQWQLWRDDTLGYHLTNVFLHILSALLVWRLLSKLGLRLAWLGGLIFAVHPVQVESVAWIAELKNTLSLPPFLMAMSAWIDYEERGKSRDYFLALGLFLAAMLCKPTMVMFPVMILLYAWWKRDRIGWNDVKASAPFFGVSLALGLVTIWFLQHHAIGEDPVPMGGLFSRLACAGLSFSFYFSKCFLPVGLLPIYPRWVVDPPTLTQFLPWPVLLAAICWMWTKRRTWGRHLLLGLGFFLINLAPFIGLNTASYMAYTWVMDHILYIPIIGLIGIFVAGLGEVEERLSASMRLGSIGLVAVLLTLLSFKSQSYAALYVNSETLWTYELQHNPEASIAYGNLGTALMKAGRLADAIEQFKQVLRIQPHDAGTRNNLGNLLLQTGQPAGAMEQFEEVLRFKPADSVTHYNFGNLLFQTGKIPEAIAQFEEVLRIEPDNALARNNLGNALQQAGRLSDAMEEYKEVLRIDPDNALAHYNLGGALQQAGQWQAAIAQYEEVLRINPDDAQAHNSLGNILSQTGQLPEAIEQLQQALRIKPDYVEAHDNLGNALLLMGSDSQAIEQFQQALQIKPDALTHYDLAGALLQAGRTEEAIEHYKDALQLKPDYAEAENNLGAALLQMGRWSEAEERFKQALRIRPDYSDAQNNLSKLQALQKAAPAKN